MRLTRRDFIRTGAAATSLAAISSPLALADSPAGTIPIGIQLFAVRGARGKDFPGTIEALAKMGYQGVEFFGYSGKSADHRGRSPKDLRKLLDDNGLKCCGMHVAPGAIEGDGFKNAVELNTALGNPFIIVAAAKSRMSSPDAIKQFANQLSEAADRAKPLGLRIGYHAHGFDFVKFDDRTAWDILFSHASPEVVMQLDIGNCLGGGGDPIAILKKFAPRSATLHVKTHSDHPLDTKSAYWNEIFTLAKSGRALEWLVVEEGGAGGSDLEIPKQCLQKLREMRI